MAKGQRKQKQETIDRNLFENLCKIQCTEIEICSVLNITDKTLNSWCNNEYGENFSEVFKKKREDGKTSLRRYQWQLAEKNPTMAIWLGKQYLGQTDKIELGTDNTEIKVSMSAPSEEDLKRVEAIKEKLLHSD